MKSFVDAAVKIRKILSLFKIDSGNINEETFEQISDNASSFDESYIKMHEISGYLCQEVANDLIDTDRPSNFIQKEKKAELENMDS